MTPSILLWTLISLQSPAIQDLKLSLVHHSGGQTVARAELELVGTTLKGSIKSDDVEVTARQVSAPEGHVVSYDRTLRRSGRLVSRLTLKLRADGEGYRLREESTVGTRRETVRTGKARAVLDGNWPESIIPLMLAVNGGDVPVIDVERGKVVLAAIRARDGGARYLDVPGGGPTVDVGTDGAFQRLRLPGATRTVVVPAGSEVRAAGPTVPFSVVESEVELPTGLRATISMPRVRPGSIAGVVLVADSGAHDRNGDGPSGGSGLLRDLAWDLADRGLAVLRFDPRDTAAPGVGLSTLKEDVRGAGMLLGSKIEVDAKRIAVIGHGQGGLVAVLATADRPDLFAAAVGLAAPARPLRQAMTARLRARLLEAGQSAAAVRSAEMALQKDLDRIRDAKEVTGAGERLLRDLMLVVPVDLYLDARIPLLLLYGEDDQEVPIGHRALLQTAVALHGAGRADLQVLSGADHQFLETRGGGSHSGAADVARRRHPSLGPTLMAFLEQRLAKK